jgi:diguanylate cyclase (GGDEF)-like protein
LAASFVLTNGEAGALGVVSERFGLLYTISLGSMVFAIFLFVLMVDAARAEAYRNLQAANAATRELAERDELTGLLNRRALEQLLREAVQASAKAEAVAVLIIDLDGFKEVNDTYGHHIGDKLIQEVSRRLSALSRRRNCVPARLGGDEFAIVVTGEDARRAARHVAEEAQAFVDRPIEIDGRGAAVGMSVGLAWSAAEIDAQELLRRADVAMYEAKRQGKGRLCEYHDGLDARRVRRIALATELGLAIERKRIAVHYQPIVDARTREIVGVEALARWTDLRGNPVAPDEFIPVAEESGLINKLGLLVLETACQDAAKWPNVKLSVNLSPVQFRSATFVEDILLVLERTAFPAKRLELEVTEGYLIDHSELVLPLIERLRAAGIAFALDDFGIGYSSIGYLRQYQFDRLKIDKSLVRAIAADASARGMIEATAMIARSLSLQLTAEGVESEEQANLLRLAGCSNLQGYLFGQSQPARLVGKLLSVGGSDLRAAYA